MTTTLLEHLAAYRTDSADKLSIYAKDATEMGKRFARAMRDHLGAKTDDPQFGTVIGDMKEGVVEVHTTLSLGNRLDAAGMAVFIAPVVVLHLDSPKIAVTDSIIHVWQIYLEHGEWCVKSSFWSNAKDLSEVKFDETVAAAVKCLCESIMQSLDKNYYQARWAKRYGRV